VFVIIAYFSRLTMAQSVPLCKWTKMVLKKILNIIIRTTQKLNLWQKEPINSRIRSSHGFFTPNNFSLRWGQHSWKYSFRKTLHISIARLTSQKKAADRIATWKIVGILLNFAVNSIDMSLTTQHAKKGVHYYPILMEEGALSRCH
jgi:hypothetical protein